MSGFDPDRLREVTVSQVGLSKLRLFPKVYPYAFWVWQVPEVQRQGAMVCFRDECRVEIGRLPGCQSDPLVDGQIRADCRRHRWPQRLTFLPASIDWPATFRVLYQVQARDLERATELWAKSECAFCIAPTRWPR